METMAQTMSRFADTAPPNKNITVYPALRRPLHQRAPRIQHKRHSNKRQLHIEPNSDAHHTCMLFEAWVNHGGKTDATCELERSGLDGSPHMPPDHRLTFSVAMHREMCQSESFRCYCLAIGSLLYFRVRRNRTPRTAHGFKPAPPPPGEQPRHMTTPKPMHVQRMLRVQQHAPQARRPLAGPPIAAMMPLR